jgi:hypothetical protein
MSKAIVAVACVALAASPALGQGGKSIRDVDFMNLTYSDTPCYGEGGSIAVKNGLYERDSEDDKEYFKILGVVYGDLTGDGVEEAVVSTYCNTGGTGQFTDALVFTMRGGKPVVVGELGIGDRADGGLYNVVIRGGVLYADRYGHGEGSGACCPEYIETEAIRWNGSKFVATGKPTRRKYQDFFADDSPAPHRVTFLRGTSTASLAGLTTGKQSYLLGARAGQTLAIRFDPDDDTAAVVVATSAGERVGGATGKGEFSLKLPATGDYLISITSKKGPDDDTVSYTMDVTIK